MYQYNSIMSAVNDFIDEVNAADSEAKLIKPHTIKEAYELLAEYYGKESGAELLAEYESGRPHDVADATKLLLDVLKNKEENKGTRWPFYYVSDGKPIAIAYNPENNTGIYLEISDGLKLFLTKDISHISGSINSFIGHRGSISADASGDIIFYNRFAYMLIFEYDGNYTLYKTDSNGNKISISPKYTLTEQLYHINKYIILLITDILYDDYYFTLEATSMIPIGSSYYTNLTDHEKIIVNEQIRRTIIDYIENGRSVKSDLNYLETKVFEG